MKERRCAARHLPSVDLNETSYVPRASPRDRFHAHVSNKCICTHACLRIAPLVDVEETTWQTGWQSHGTKACSARNWDESPFSSREESQAASKFPCLVVVGGFNGRSSILNLGDTLRVVIPAR